MNKSVAAAIAALGILLAAGGGYWLGQQGSGAPGAPDKTAQGGASGPGSATKGPGGPAPGGMAPGAAGSAGAEGAPV